MYSSRFIAAVIHVIHAAERGGGLSAQILAFQTGNWPSGWNNGMQKGARSSLQDSELPVCGVVG